MYPSNSGPDKSVVIGRGHAYTLTAQSGTIAAALAQDSILFALRCGAADGRSIYLDRISLAFTTIAAFTTPITAGRRLGLYRATNPGAEVSGGTDLLATIRQRDSDSSVPATAAVKALIATTAGLTVGGLVREAAPFATLDLVSSGAAGARIERIYELNAGVSCCEQPLNPGEYVVVSVPQAMDAGGTWQLNVNELSWFEQRRALLLM